MQVRRHALVIEQTYLRFISSTRLGLLIAACAVASFVAIISLGLERFAVCYTVALFLPLAAAALWKRREFGALSLGSNGWLKAALIGFLPSLVFVSVLCGLVYNLHLSYHAPISRYVSPILDGIPASQNWVVFEIPFVEEVIFRLWLQTRLQQYVGIIGAVVSCMIFVAVHLTVSPWRIAVAVLLTVLRYRSGSLAACIIAHYTYDVGLWAFVAFVH